MIAVNKELKSICRADLELNLEMLVIQLQLECCQNLTLATFYRSPGSDSSFVDYFGDFLQSLGNKKLSILGDFNFPYINWESLAVPSDSGDEFKFCELIQDYYLSQMICMPTRISSAGSSNIVD